MQFKILHLLHCHDEGEIIWKNYSGQCASEDTALWAKHDLCINPLILRILELVNE